MIELADIADVVIKREPTLVGRLHKAKKEVRRQSIFLFLNGGEGIVYFHHCPSVGLSF
jgi:hypothetical protein